MRNGKLLIILGKKVILYFYPKDNTAGCIKQVRGFSELSSCNLTEKRMQLFLGKYDLVASPARDLRKNMDCIYTFGRSGAQGDQSVHVWKEQKTMKSLIW